MFIVLFIATLGLALGFLIFSARDNFEHRKLICDLLDKVEEKANRISLMEREVEDCKIELIQVKDNWSKDVRLHNAESARRAEAISRGKTLEGLLKNCKGRNQELESDLAETTKQYELLTSRQLWTVETAENYIGRNGQIGLKKILEGPTVEDPVEPEPLALESEPVESDCN